MKTKNKPLIVAAGIVNCIIAVLITVILVRLCILFFSNEIAIIFLLPFVGIPILYAVMIILGMPLAANAAGGIGTLVCLKIKAVNGFLIVNIVATCANLPMSLIVFMLTSSIAVYCMVFAIIALSFVGLGLSIAALAKNKVRADIKEPAAEDRDGEEQK